MISTFGNVRTISSGYTTHDSKSSDGYLSAYLKGSDGKSKSMLIHRLVAHAFLSNSENKRTVDHINRDKENNHVLNLQWATDSEQRRNRVEKTTNNSARPVYQLNLEKKYSKLWNSIKDASIGSGVSKSSIGRCCRGEQKIAGNFIWKYLDDVRGDLPNEIWRDIPLSDWNYYQAFNMGRFRQKNGRILKGNVKGNKYVRIGIDVSGGKIVEYAHKLIAYTFLNYDGGYNLEPNHKKLNKFDNRVENLELIPHYEGSIHAMKNGARSNMIRVNKLDILGNIVATYTCIAETSRETEINWAAINKACQNGQIIDNIYRFQYVQQ